MNESMNGYKTMIILFQMLNVNYTFQIELRLKNLIQAINFILKVIQLLSNIILTVHVQKAKCGLEY